MFELAHYLKKRPPRYPVMNPIKKPMFSADFDRFGCRVHCALLRREDLDESKELQRRVPSWTILSMLDTRIEECIIE